MINLAQFKHITFVLQLNIVSKIPKIESIGSKGLRRVDDFVFCEGWMILCFVKCG